MNYSIDLTNFRPRPLYDLEDDFSGSNGRGVTISFNNYCMEMNRKPFFAVSGELHYSRMNPLRWEDELIKMRMGGVNIVSSYVFWNHHEEEEGVFDFSGRRDLRKFIGLCAKHGLYVILRIGPFAHGEVRNGGLPDWLFGKPFGVRSLDEGFIEYTERFYRETEKQIKGLLFRDGGPVIAIQLDNEYMHSSAKWEMTAGSSDEWIDPGRDGEAYMLKLREIALKVGIEPVFFTGTAWGGAAYSRRIMPLWGGYAYRPWLYYTQTGEHPATEVFVYEDYHHDGISCIDDFKPAYKPSERPYACCEMGAGMMSCYSFRAQFPCESVDALANIKLGSGCNFIGYYMFHGGTNPVGKNGTYLNESQVTKLSYDFQAPVGEFGQLRESYSRLKSIHFFTRFFGDRLALMETVLPDGAMRIDPKDAETLRFAVRTDGKGGFLFVNNYQDHSRMTAKVNEKVSIALGNEKIEFDISIAPGENAILPFNLDLDGMLLKQADAQPVLRTVIGGRVHYVFTVPEGMDGKLCFEKEVKLRGYEGKNDSDGGNAFLTASLNGHEINILLISRDMANRMFLLRNGGLVFTEDALLEDEKGRLRLETIHPENCLYTYPADLLTGRKAAVRQENDGVLGRYVLKADPVLFDPGYKKVSEGKYIIEIPHECAEALTGANDTAGRVHGDRDFQKVSGLKDIRLQIRYSGDTGMLFLGDRLINDNFSNGDSWEIGLKEHAAYLKEPMILKITPMNGKTRVTMEKSLRSADTAENEADGELGSIGLLPVYEIDI